MDVPSYCHGVPVDGRLYGLCRLAPRICKRLACPYMGRELACTYCRWAARHYMRGTPIRLASRRATGTDQELACVQGCLF